MHWGGYLLYNDDMVPIRRLLFEEVAPGQPFHAALALSRPPRPDPPHTHDFAEAFYVLDGAGLHFLNGETLPLHAGDLVWIRPTDVHVLASKRGSFLHYINIAFPCAAWDTWRRVAGVGGREYGQIPVEAGRRSDAAACFERALRAFQRGPTGLDICRFWGDALALSDSRTPDEADTIARPAWLARACAAMGGADNLRAGVPRFVELAGTSAAHLARVLKSTDGQTPTEWVTERRLRRAERLLLTTTQEIADIALDCGFDNLSYFYRCFKARAGLTPRVFRLGPHRKVL